MSDDGFAMDDVVDDGRGGLPPAPNSVLEPRVVDGVVRMVAVTAKTHPFKSLAEAGIGEALAVLGASVVTGDRACGICGQESVPDDCEDGWVFGESGGRMCAFQRSRLEAERFSGLMAAIGLDESKFERGWDKLTVKHESWRTAQSVSVNISSVHAQCLNLFFWGKLGRGKTHAALLVCRDAVRVGLSTARVRWSEFVRRVRASFDDGAGETEHALVRVLVAADLLLIDEITEDITDFSRGLLRDVLQQRDDAKRPTLITANLTPQELRKALEQRGGDRFFSKLLEVCFNGEKFRDDEADTVADLKSEILRGATPMFAGGVS